MTSVNTRKNDAACMSLRADARFGSNFALSDVMYMVFEGRYFESEEGSETIKEGKFWHF